MKFSIAKCIGVAAVLLGAVCTWEILRSQFVQSIAEREADALRLIGSFIGMSILSIPFLLALFFGFKVFQEPNKTNICRAAGIQLGIAAAFGASKLSLLADVIAKDTEIFSFALLTLAYAALPIYVWIAKAAMRSEGLVTEGLHDLFAKPFVAVFAFLVFGAAHDLFGLFGPAKAEFDPFDLYEYSEVFVPLLAAYTTYKIFAVIVGLEPRDLDHFFSKRFVLFLALFAWVITFDLVSSEPAGRPDGLFIIVPYLAAGVVYFGLRTLARLGHKESEPVRPTHA